MFIWDEEKNLFLKKTRGVSFEEVADIILNETYIDFFEHPKRQDQFIFVVKLHQYIYAVPCVFDAQNNIVLKTIYPNRKYYKKYI